MSEPSIPTALDPHGNHVPIEEAMDKLDYYRCPQCKEFVDPRQGPKRQYFAHKRGVIDDDKSCALSSQADVDEMVDELRTSDIEKDEAQRSIRVYLGEHYEREITCFGIIPSLEWEQVPDGVDVNRLLSQLEISTKGVTNPPVPKNFHPSEPEAMIPLDPDAEEFKVDIAGPEKLDAIIGLWTAEGLSTGNLFAGDQRRARRHKSNRQIKEGEWVYVLTPITSPHLSDFVTTYKIGSYNALAFPAREETKNLLEEYGDGLKTDTYGFDVDVILPADAHPTIEAPVYGAPHEEVLIGITPPEEIDPMFEVVTIPKRTGDVVNIRQTGPGNPRYYPTTIPQDGSQRVSIHQRNSDRHRLVHLHPADSDKRTSDIEGDSRVIGVKLHIGDEAIFLSPFKEKQTHKFDHEFNPHTLPVILDYVGPKGLELEVTGSFIDDATLGPVISRFTTEIEDLAEELITWITKGCESIQIELGGLGTVELAFSQPALTTAFDLPDNKSEPIE
ncbi:hypothetical protein K0C01_05270 [Salinarchaeum sp. IM2453]|uniref:hypothetical protein n=1 Tax=Salinarchaeum sp. IM2453 TaxID=2862870 RepID=UPI001C8323AE|nr:hypothetical protein [Salinarchaeum sp. IM2453]QZA89542.1 hypothetical protein K0C01_05270 [Salinarchaeum sp. IM2453]